jgi:hypothetical protein
MPRYVILDHDFPERHWDFMLEAGEVLRTWKLAAQPEVGRNSAAEASFDHRRLYLYYEGPVSGGRGTVACWDRGSFTWQCDSIDRVVVELAGQRCQGVVVLTRSADGRWSFLLRKAEGESRL